MCGGTRLTEINLEAEVDFWVYPLSRMGIEIISKATHEDDTKAATDAYAIWGKTHQRLALRKATLNPIKRMGERAYGAESITLTCWRANQKETEFHKIFVNPVSNPPTLIVYGNGYDFVVVDIVTLTRLYSVGWLKRYMGKVYKTDEGKYDERGCYAINMPDLISRTSPSLLIRYITYSHPAYRYLLEAGAI